MIWVILLCLAILAILIHFLYWKEGAKPWLKDCLECLLYSSFLLLAYSFASDVATTTAPSSSTVRVTHAEEPSGSGYHAVAEATPKFMWPVEGKILSPSGKYPKPGIDFKISSGTVVRASSSGEVIYAGKDISGHGLTVRLRHPLGYESIYAHNNELTVELGQQVQKGQELAKSVTSRKYSRQKFHFELTRDGKPVEAEEYQSLWAYSDVPPPVTAAASNVDTSSTCGISPGGGCFSSSSEVLPPSRAISITDGPTHFSWPARGRIIQGYSKEGEGINIALVEGSSVKAVEEGEVAFAGSQLKGYGNMILVRHPNGFVSAYAHNRELLVARGDKVKRGQVIAKSGQTGNIGSPQLHFELRKGSTPVDPTMYLAGI
jgi:murein DD-endopeptidase MepM/ murein hydrolase activator NlpD